MHEQTIQLIAQAIIANTKVLQSLVDSLPHEASTAVAAIVSPAVPSPAPIHVAAPAPAPIPMPVIAPVQVAAPAPAPVPSFMPAAPAPAVSPVGAMSRDDFTRVLLGKYQQLGPVRGVDIQNILTAHGYRAVTEVDPAKFAEIVAQVNAMV